MPGHERSRFVDNKPKELDEFTCGICHGIFVNPVFTQCCQQTYCSDCINEWLTTRNTCPNDRNVLFINGLSEPPRIIKNLLADLVITCDNQAAGCQARVKLSELDKHSAECEYRPNAVCKVCHIVRSSPSSH